MLEYEHRLHGDTPTAMCISVCIVMLLSSIFFNIRHNQLKSFAKLTQQHLIRKYSYIYFSGQLGIIALLVPLLLPNSFTLFMLEVVSLLFVPSLLQVRRWRRSRGTPPGGYGFYPEQRTALSSQAGPPSSGFQ